MSIRVLVASGSQVFHQGLCDILAGQTRIEVVGEATDPEFVFDLIEKCAPDVLLWQITNFQPEIEEILERTQRMLEPPKVVVMAVWEGPGMVARLLSAGCKGFLSLNENLANLCQAITAASCGQTWMSELVSNLLAQALHAGEREESLHDRKLADMLSPRELEVLRLIQRGRTNDEIALDMAIGQRTARHYVERIFNKLGVNNRTEAVIKGLKIGLIELGERD